MSQASKAFPGWRVAIVTCGLIITASTGGHAQLAAAIPAYYQGLFFDAARMGRVDLLEGMIRDGMAVDAQDARGYTALILASYDGHADAVALLLRDGADACVKDPKGDNALMGVAFKGEAAIAEMLIPHCNVNATNKEGQSAAMMGALFGHEDIVRLLVNHGARLGLKDASGNTALSLARQQGNTKMRTLLESLPQTP